MSDPDKAINFILKNAPLFAAAQSQHDHLCEYRKAKKASLMLASGETSAVMREADAYANPEYLQVLEGIRISGEEAINLKWQLDAAKLRVEIWRSQEASNRSQDRTMR